MKGRIKKLLFMYFAVLELRKKIVEKVMVQWVPVNIIVITRPKLTLKLNLRPINFRLLREHKLN